MKRHHDQLPPAPHTGRLLDARLHLLDRQLLDADDNPVGILDDLEIEDPSDHSRPRVTGIVSGHALLTRIFGGRPPASQMQVIPWRLVARVGAVVTLAPTDMTFDGLWLEHWLRDRLIARIPGGRHAAQ